MIVNANDTRTPAELAELRAFLAAAAAFEALCAEQARETERAQLPGTGLRHALSRPGRNWTCSRCRTSNSNNASVCSNCGSTG